MRFWSSEKSKLTIPLQCIRNYQFCLKILAAMNELQCNHKYLYGDGLVEHEILTLMQERYNLDGDLKTQCRISLRQLVIRGLITKEGGRYRLVGPMVRVMQKPIGSVRRNYEIERVSKVFWPENSSNPKPAITKLYTSLRKFWRK